MEYVDKYVYVNAANKTPLDAYRIKIDLGENINRVPTQLIEVISATAVGRDMSIDAYTVKCENMADNYYSSDLMGTALCSLNINGSVETSPTDSTLINTFALAGYAPKLVFGGQMRYLTIYLEDTNGLKQELQYVAPFSMLIKVSYPVIGSIGSAYRSQIPL